MIFSLQEDEHRNHHDNIFCIPERGGGAHVWPELRIEGTPEILHAQVVFGILADTGILNHHYVMSLLDKAIAIAVDAHKGKTVIRRLPQVSEPDLDRLNFYRAAYRHLQS